MSRHGNEGLSSVHLQLCPHCLESGGVWLVKEGGWTLYEVSIILKFTKLQPCFKIIHNNIC